jgi:hypothetical protein
LNPPTIKCAESKEPHHALATSENMRMIGEISPTKTMKLNICPDRPAAAPVRAGAAPSPPAIKCTESNEDYSAVAISENKIIE